MAMKLPARKFVQAYPPSQYAATWHGVNASRQFHVVPDKFNEHHAKMVQELRKQGIAKGVRVHDGRVVDGHHHVVAAIEANVPIKFKEVSAKKAKKFAKQHQEKL